MKLRQRIEITGRVKGAPVWIGQRADNTPVLLLQRHDHSHLMIMAHS